ncbi:MAG TPA: hypothetical protein VG370_01055 [Chloroflexota bacterium]|nr:hypothetical protein [Chloroflexota bacterium]
MADAVSVAVGGGGVSQGHFPTYAASPKARLLAAVEVRPELAEAAAKRWPTARISGSARLGTVSR